jgi:hypothetical protein
MMPPQRTTLERERMTPGSVTIVMLAVLRVLPVVFGSKACRKFGLGAVLIELRAQIPDNGTGPVIADRRHAVAFLEENCRQCGRCRLGRRI